MIEQKRLQSHPPICTVPEEQKEKSWKSPCVPGISFWKMGRRFHEWRKLLTGSAVITGLNPPIPLY